MFTSCHGTFYMSSIANFYLVEDQSAAAKDFLIFILLAGRVSARLGEPSSEDTNSFYFIQREQIFQQQVGQ